MCIAIASGLIDINLVIFSGMADFVLLRLCKNSLLSALNISGTWWRIQPCQDQNDSGARFPSAKVGCSVAFTTSWKKESTAVLSWLGVRTLRDAAQGVKNGPAFSPMSPRIGASSTTDILSVPSLAEALSVFLYARILVQSLLSKDPLACQPTMAI
jgi:hypothetical protein